MDKYITESEMKFGPFDESVLFHIEKSDQYISIQKGMHITEFIFYDEEKNRIVSLEAKKTAPNPHSGKIVNPQTNFANYINEIKEKFENSLDLYSRVALNKQLPSGFRKIKYKDVNILLVLVIKNHEKEWLKDVNDALGMAVHSVKRLDKIWKCKAIAINEEQAISYKFVQAK